MKRLIAVTICLLWTLPALPCDFLKLKLKSTKEQKIATGVVRLGTLASSPKDNDPVVAYFENGKQVFCNKDYDTTGTDARPVAATADKDHLYVAFSVNGGGTSANSFSRFTGNGWIKSYGSGSGPKALLILRLAKSSGEAVAGTYVIAQKADGKTNSVILKSLNFSDGKLAVIADAWLNPLTVGGAPFSCSGKSPFRYNLDLQPDLTAARAAAADRCAFK